MILLKNYFINTTKDVDVISIIHDVNYAIRDSGAEEGLATVTVPGPGAAVTIIHPLPENLAELKEALKIFPGEGKEAQTRRKESVKIGARIKAAMLGKSLSIPFKSKKLILDTREEIVLLDFESEGKRREYVVQVLSEGGGEEGQQGGMPLGAMGGEEEW